MSKKGPLKSTDRRRVGTKSAKITKPDADTDGAGPPLANLFSDRRTQPRGKRAF